MYSLRVDRLENPNALTRLARENPQEWTGCQADAIEHLCSEVTFLIKVLKQADVLY